MDKDYESIEELEASFDTDFAAEESEAPEELEVPEVSTGDESEDKAQETQEESRDNTEDTPTEDEKSEEESAPEKPQPETPQLAKVPKKDLVALREAKKEIEQKFKAERARNKRLAKQAGFGNDVDGYLKMLDDKLLEREAEASNLTPEQYVQQIRKEQEVKGKEEVLTQRERAIQEKENQLRFITFDSTLQNIVKEYNLTDNERDNLLNGLGKEGYTLEQLINLPNPGLILKGALVGTIVSKKEQERLERESKFKDLDSDPINSEPQNSKTIDELEDELIKQEMEEYMRERGYK